jgi:D-proline reductase (dithiol) PrdB
VSTLAHVFEAAGLATIVLSSIRNVVERIHPPRALHCEFPLGRPLGKPGDAAFQHDVLARAFALLDAPSGPVLVDHPDTIVSDESPLACTIPPRFDPSLPAAVDEACGIRKAYDRVVAKRGVSSIGRVLNADEVPNALAVIHGIANGDDWTQTSLSGPRLMQAVHDIRAYYEEAALELANVAKDGRLPDGSAAGGRQTEAWFFEQTEAGKVILAARQAVKASGVPHPVWFYLAPANR